jgi:predicted NAD/FAD-binding protein
MESFLSHDDFSTWLRCMLMYAYSMHYEQVAAISADLAVPMLREFLVSTHWTHMPHGVSSYVDAVARSLRGVVVTNASIRGVLRSPDGVTVVHHDGNTQPFDAVVMAVPPHRVLPLLGDPSEEESRWFSAFKGGLITTVLHTDSGPYQRRGAHAWTEFDLFELPSGGHGYNAYLNRLSGVPEDGPVQYGLAFDLDSEIDPSKVLHRQSHDVAAYTGHALATRTEVAELNGRNHTWFVGAFLGDGLHEGAVRSALNVSARLGGRSLPGFTPGNGHH